MQRHVVLHASDSKSRIAILHLDTHTDDVPTSRCHRSGALYNRIVEVLQSTAGGDPQTNSAWNTSTPPPQPSWQSSWTSAVQPVFEFDGARVFWVFASLNFNDWCLLDEASRRHAFTFEHFTLPNMLVVAPPFPDCDWCQFDATLHRRFSDLC